MNIELLERIKAKILEEPENFEMATWHCGTAHCIGGWAAILATGKETRYVAFEATLLLGLSAEQAGRLFVEYRWPKQFRKPCTVAGQRAKQAAARINHYIATEGRE